MDSVRIQTHIGDDGILTLELPDHLKNRSVDVVVMIQPVEDEAVDEHGWPIGFFDRTYGALAHDPIERPPELPYDVRDELE